MIQGGVGKSLAGPCCLAPDEFAASGEPLLGVVTFGTTVDLPPQVPRLIVGLPALSPLCIEAWTTAAPVVFGNAGPLRFAHDGTVLFGTIEIGDERLALEDAAREVYTTLIRGARDAGYPHLLRLWNHVGAINEKQNGLERYKRFCLGRSLAFESLGYRLSTDLPAASAVGTPAGGVAVYFLAGREQGTQIENPRQVAAYAYPERYGPRSPSFSRATVAKMGGAHQLFLSGTSSVVGHETCHDGDVMAQLDETLVNVEQLMARAAEACGYRSNGLAGLRTIKVYLRHAEDLAAVARRVETIVHGDQRVMYLNAGICRRELLIEIEGIE